MKRIALYFSTFCLFLACNNAQKKIDNDDILQLENCISKIVSNHPSMEDCYLVNPYYLDLSTYERDKTRLEIFLNKNDLKKDMFDNNDRLYQKELIDLSGCDKSNIVFTFSKIVDNYMLIKLEARYDEIEKDLLDQVTDYQNSHWEFYLFEIGNNNSIIQIDHIMISK